MDLKNIKNIEENSKKNEDHGFPLLNLIKGEIYANESTPRNPSSNNSKLVVKGEVVGLCSTRKKNNMVIVDILATRYDCIGRSRVPKYKGVGSLMLAKVAFTVKKDETLVLSSHPGAKNFYKKIGMKEESNNYFTLDYNGCKELAKKFGVD